MQLWIAVITIVHKRGLWMQHWAVEIIHTPRLDIELEIKMAFS